MKDQGQASKAAPINHSGSGNDSTLESQFADHNGGYSRGQRWSAPVTEGDLISGRPAPISPSMDSYNLIGILG
jgi:hypothetical protein